MTAVLDADSWDAWRPEEAARRLAGVQAPWYVAAGWSIDLFLGGERRDHEDLEIAIPAAALDEVVAALDGFDVYAVKVPGKGDFTPVAEAGDDRTWICRRDERIRLPYAEVIAHTPEGIPYGRPEVTLLYKAKHSREKDEADFEAALPRLDAAARDRLSGWLELVHPGHHWIARLG